MINDIFYNLTNNFDLSGLKTEYLPETTKTLSFYHSDEINWIKISILGLIAFGVYNLTIANLINTDHIPHQNLKLAINDILKFGTIFIFLRFISGEPLMDFEWIVEFIYIMVGFFTYDFIVVDFIDTNELLKNKKISKETKMAIEDTMKFLTMFIVSRWLSGKKFSKEWIMNVTGFIVGLVAYDYLLSELI